MQTNNTTPADGQAKSAFRLGHRPALDGLRAIFVLLILAVHGGVSFMQGAGLGVDCFFVLSGFLITCLLLQEWQQHGSISLRRFYARRALRLLPGLYALLLIVSLVTITTIKGEGAVATGRGVMLSAVYISNWVTLFFGVNNIGLGLMSHSWSLAIEEQFYLVWPVALVGLLSLRLTAKQLVLCTGLLAAGSALWRFWLLQTGSFTIRLDFGSDTRADSLLIGCTLGAMAAGGMLLPSARAARLTRWLALVGIAILAYLVVDSGWTHNLAPYYGLFTLISLSIAAPIVHLLISPHGHIARLLSWKPLVQLGVVSYGVYLWHNPVFHLLSTGAEGWVNWPVQLARLSVTAVLVVISYHYFERPMLRIKERLSGVARAVPPAPVAAYAAQSETA